MMEGTQEAARAWFTEFQLDRVVRDGIVPEWFHGIISRKAAEDMLLSKPPGHFLLRISESRIGYSLSYRAEDRCRHFMVDAQWDGSYAIVGEDACHRSLQDLLDFHRRIPIMPFNELLTVACGQVSKDKADYAELISPKERPVEPNLDPPPHTHNSNNNTHLDPDCPPALPHRPTTMTDSILSSPHSNKACPAVPDSHPPRLYPCLETQLSSVTLEHPTMMDSSDKPVPLPRKRLAAQTNTAVPADQPPELPARDSVPQRNAQTPTPVPGSVPQRNAQTPTPAPGAVPQRNAQTPAPVPGAVPQRNAQTATPVPGSVPQRNAQTPTPVPGSVSQRNAQTPTPVPDDPLGPWLADSDRPLVQPNVHQPLDVPSQPQPGRGQEGKSTVMNHIKRKFQKRRTSSQEHMYAEINEEEVGERGGQGQGTLASLQARERDSGLGAENEYQELPVKLSSFPPPPGGTHPHLQPSSAPALSPADSGVPPEYLQPPPFAPGY